MPASSSFDTCDDYPWRPATLQVRGGLRRSGFDETSEGLFLTSGYVYGSAAEAQTTFEGEIDRYIYSRYGTPNVGVFEEPLRLIEGAEVCKATGTDSPNSLSPSPSSSPSNSSNGQTSGTNDRPICARSKHIDGQGRTLGGAVPASEQFIDEHLQLFYRHTGPAMSPFNAWVALKGLETLELRVRAQSASALTVAQWLDDHGSLAAVRCAFLASHPQRELARRQMATGGTVVAFPVAGSTSRGFEIVDALNVFDISNNLGDTKSSVTHPGTMTHRMLTPEERLDVGLHDGTIRLSIGVEGVADLNDEPDRALVGGGGFR